MAGVKCLLDTHALLWWLADDDRLGPAPRALIADPATEALVSVVSLWEITVKQRIGKLAADIPALLRATEAAFPLLPIRPAHLRRLAALPAHHRDPFDHLLIAQAQAERARFITADARAALYPVTVLGCGSG